MNGEDAQHILYQILNCQMMDYPFPHFYTEKVFSEKFYQRLLSSIPDKSLYRKIGDTGSVPNGAYEERFVFSLEEKLIDQLPKDKRVFWRDLTGWILSSEFFSRIFDKFGEDMEERFQDYEGDPNFSTKASLVRDETNYSIGPHTDIPKKVLTLLFNLPETDENSHWGTSIYVPKDPEFICSVGRHYPFEGFELVRKFPFKPNSVFGFFRTDNSFHGLSPILDEGAKRNTLTYRVDLDF
ncbi:MAG: hypothetical protein ACI9S8_001488 [Chlamydiales bacterium]